MKIHGTAKGGALSKKDFGVAFGGAAAVVCENYGATSQDNVQEMDGTKRNYSLKMLEDFPMIGCKIASAKFYVRYYSSFPQPDGNMYATLYNSSGAVRDTSSAINMNTLTTSLAWKEFAFSSPSTVDEDDFISFTTVYDDSPGEANGLVQVGRDSSGAPDTAELWIGGTDSPDDITQENIGRQPSLELIAE